LSVWRQEEVGNPLLLFAGLNDFPKKFPAENTHNAPLTVRLGIRCKKV
jgi:hypothetical protein